MKHFEHGSSPVELVATIALLVLPVAPMTLLFEQISNELAAESIARHALRRAILSAPENPQVLLPKALSELSVEWGKEVTDYRFWCEKACVLQNLEVIVGGASAVQTMGLEP
jgi:ABC-type uncharacterized transport system YnjBCD ATPase subunit